jgi:hypothetical protein
LFSFDDPSPAPAPPLGAADDDFSGFQSAGAAPAVAVNGPFGGDPFASSGPTIAPTGFSYMGQQQQSDPFAAPTQQSQLPSNINSMNTMFGNMSMDGNVGGTNPMMGGMNPMIGNTMMGGGMMGTNNSAMAGRASNGMAPAPAPAADFDDDFGDFEGVSGGPSVGSAPSSTRNSSGPFGSLVTLDGLSKNSKKEDKLNEPIVINAAAAQYMQDKQHGVGVAAPQNTAKSAEMSFAGIDGLPKSPPPNSMGIGMGGAMGMGGMSFPAASGGMNLNVMGSASSGNASLIGALDPQLMSPQPPKPQQPQGMVGMTPAQQQQMMQMMMMQNPQVMQQMMMNGGKMTPQQQQQMMQMMMMSQQQLMGGGQQAGGGMMGGGNNNTMGGQGGFMGGHPMGGGGFGGF